MAHVREEGTLEPSHLLGLCSSRLGVGARRFGLTTGGFRFVQRALGLLSSAIGLLLGGNEGESAFDLRGNVQTNAR
jgi:hypothetical protein